MSTAPSGFALAKSTGKRNSGSGGGPPAFVLQPEHIRRVVTEAIVTEESGKLAIARISIPLLPTISAKNPKWTMLAVLNDYNGGNPRMAFVGDEFELEDGRTFQMLAKIDLAMLETTVDPDAAST